MRLLVHCDGKRTSDCTTVKAGRNEFVMQQRVDCCRGGVLVQDDAWTVLVGFPIIERRSFEVRC